VPFQSPTYSSYLTKVYPMSLITFDFLATHCINLILSNCQPVHPSYPHNKTLSYVFISYLSLSNPLLPTYVTFYTIISNPSQILPFHLKNLIFWFIQQKNLILCFFLILILPTSFPPTYKYLILSFILPILLPTNIFII